MTQPHGASMHSGTAGAASSPNPAAAKSARVTVASLAAMREPFACLTCYDATTARWLARAGVHVLLVGDTAAEMVLGLPRTIDMPLDVLLALTAGVKRGAQSAGEGLRVPMVMGDMPFMSYQASPDDAMRNAGRFLVEGLADIVKLEADASLSPLIDRMVRAGVPVCAHVGSRPQRSVLTGGYKAEGRTPGDRDRVIADAKSLQDAGASMLLIEAVPEETAAGVMAIARVPVIGIGAGPATHGQVLVLQDLLGLTDAPPSFVDRASVASLGDEIRAAASHWVETVARRGVPASPYRMKP